MSLSHWDKSLELPDMIIDHDYTQDKSRRLLNCSLSIKSLRKYIPEVNRCDH
uniref:Uncharacterized protein n=1 Tax=Arundo donax TaxID=35708 RepID=A0A0A9AKP5_ARUDO